MTIFYSFTGRDGAFPQAALLQGNDGNFYGSTYAGGVSNAGTVFTVTPAGALTSLYSFTGRKDGNHPTVSLVLGRDGDFYGTTYYGGTQGSGTVFKITPAGGPTRF